jgi:hypothetical protein
MVAIDLPMGELYVPDMRLIQRARSQDLNQTQTYKVSFVRNSIGRVVLDRRRNTAEMLALYYGSKSLDSLQNRISWDVDDPNELVLRLPAGGEVETRVTRRLQEAPEPRRIETSEFVRQTFATEDGGGARVKASQCFTKYKWRTAGEAQGGGPRIVATQVVSDYLTSFDNSEKFMQSMGKPVVVYTYKMAFFPI